MWQSGHRGSSFEGALKGFPARGFKRDSVKRDRLQSMRPQKPQLEQKITPNIVKPAIGGRKRILEIKMQKVPSYGAIRDSG